MKSDIVEAFAQMAKEKNIDRDVLESIIKDSFRKMMEKRYGLESNFEVIVNMEKGNIEIFLYKIVVKEIEDPLTEIDQETAAEKSGEEFDIGDDYVEEIPYEQFGRRLVLNLKQNLNQKIREIEKEITFNKYKDQVGDLIVSEVYQIKPNSILLIHNGSEIIFPRSEQIPKERYRKGDTIRAIIKSVEKRSSGPPLIIVSRAEEQFLYKLFELEIPEIYDGIIEIKTISREPGERAKIAVYSHDDRIDAVGACVGMKGIRIHSIVRELSNENIDVINYTDDQALFIARALSPAKLQDIYIDTDDKIAKIYADEDQVSLIIGKSGQNIKLASKLTGYEIDVIREEEEVEKDDEETEEKTEEEVVEKEVKKRKPRKSKKKVEESEAEEKVEEETTEEVETKKDKVKKRKPKKSKKKVEEGEAEKVEEETTEEVEAKKDKVKKRKPKKSKKKVEEGEAEEKVEEETTEEVEAKKDKVKKRKPKKSKKKVEESEAEEKVEEETTEEVETKKEKVKKRKSKKDEKKIEETVEEEPIKETAVEETEEETAEEPETGKEKKVKRKSSKRSKKAEESKKETKEEEILEEEKQINRI